MAYQKTSQGAYISGGSLKSNLLEQVNIAKEGDPEDLQTRYYCLASVSVEVDWGSEKEALRTSENVRLKDPDNIANDYRLGMWDVPTMARALAQAILDADTQIKTAYGTGDPGHGTATTSIA